MEEVCKWADEPKEEDVGGRQVNKGGRPALGVPTQKSDFSNCPMSPKLGV